MAITKRQAEGSQELGGSRGSSDNGKQGSDMANGMQSKSATRFILQSKPKLLMGLRIVPVALMLAGIGASAPDASATGCYPASNVAVNGGTVSNTTTVDLSADGGLAVSSADGGDGNLAVGGSGGFIGDGGNAAAGNGGIADARANGGMIDLDNINSGNNSGNSIAVSTGSYPCSYGARNVSVNGGTVSNETNVRLSADGGTAVSSADGGDGNLAVGGNGGLFGSGGDAAAGNGGIAVAEANGGAITVGNINSGNNKGNTIVVGLGGGWFGPVSNVKISGGTVSNATTVRISADGGTAVASADGGDGNIAVGGSGGFIGEGGDAAAGNGGVAASEANGGTISVGNINSGGNEGNTIVVGP